VKELNSDGASDPVTGDIGQGLFEFLIHVVGHAFDRIIHTAGPAVKGDTASGAAHGKRASAPAANLF
jgi:hypothetical protein